MAKENRSAGKKLETNLAATTLKKFKSLCNKRGLSMAQRLRDLIQADIKKG